MAKLRGVHGPGQVRDAVGEMLERLAWQHGGTPTLCVDGSNNLGLAADLLGLLPARSLVVVQITGGMAHALAPEMLSLGSDGRRALIHPIWRTSRNALAHGLDRAAAQGRVRLPLEADEDTMELVRELREEMQAAVLEVTAAGRSVVRGGKSDDLMMATAVGVYCLDRNLLARDRSVRAAPPQPSSLGWT
jgi:hypothetical protein